ncbi:MAG: TRAP transporter substrate-binding protein DctP [Spirochaetaceae bacterium]|jgi:TRAP-type C4-dicarboxylate transport system substrate-binding protein|nr:TRAP transporter substrate-binding protein DctP [Spirochaetaceae bacterium]
MKKFLLMSVLTLVAGSFVFASGGGDSSKIQVVFAGTEGDTSGQSRMMKETADILNKTGRYAVKVYTAGSLSGDTDDLVQQAKMGGNLVIPSDPGRLASQFQIPDLNILMAPYVLTDYTILQKLPDTELYKTWQAALEAQGVVLLADMFNGFRNFYTTKDVTKLADLKGLRIRGFGNAVGNALAKYLGYAQTTMNATDIYSGIQAKSLDGCEIQASTADSYRLYEVTSSLALTKHYMLQSSFVCGKALLDKLDDTEKAFFIKTVSDTAAKYSKIIADEEQGYYDSYKSKGNGKTKINTVNTKEFSDAVAPLYTNNDLKMTAGLKATLFKQLGI